MPGLRETGGHNPFVRSQSAHCSVSLHSSPYSSGEPAITGAAALVGLFEQAVTQRRNAGSAQCRGHVASNSGSRFGGKRIPLTFIGDAQYDELFTLEIRIRFRVGGRAVINR